MIKKLIFVAVLLLAVLLRVVRLDSFPPSLNWDEVSIGYNAYSILNTGKDEWGTRSPISFRSYGDYKLPGYIYLDVLFLAFLGLNEWGIRLPSAIFGVGTVVFVYLILIKLLKNTYPSLIGMLVAATMPWLIILSRIALEANLALFLTTASFYFFIKALQDGKYLTLSALFLVGSLFSYNSNRVIVIPLIFLAVILFGKQLVKIKRFWISLLIIGLSSIVVYPLAILQDSSARYRWTKILDEGAIIKIEQLRTNSTLSDYLTKAIYNKPAFFFSESIKNYFYHFDPNFLLLNGGSHYQYSVPGTGLVQILLAPFIILGIFRILVKKSQWSYFILGWLLISPISAAITKDAPHALRSSMMTIPLILITVFGIEYALAYLNKSIYKIFTCVLIISLFLNLFLFWKNYTGQYTRNYSWAWQYGYKEVIDYVKEKSDRYQKVIFTKKYGEPHEFVLFYTRYDPAKFQTDKNLIRYKKSDWYWVDQFERYEFINDWEIKEKLANRSDLLLITSPGNYPIHGKLLKTIYFLDGNSVFDIVEL